MIRGKNYETASTFGKVMHRKLLASFFPDTVYLPLEFCTVTHAVEIYTQFFRFLL